MEGYTTKEMRRFNYLLSETDAAYHEAALRLGMSDSTMQVLYAICNNGDSCPLSEICSQSGISKQTINSALRWNHLSGSLGRQEKEGVPHG